MLNVATFGEMLFSASQAVIHVMMGEVSIKTQLHMEWQNLLLELYP